MPTGIYLRKKMSNETKIKIGINSAKYWKDRTFSEEHRKNLSISHTGKKGIKSMLGKKHSSEAKLKISQGVKKKYEDIEFRNKMKRVWSQNGYAISIGLKGKKLSEEHKKKISLHNGKYWLGKKRSEDARQKMSIGLKGKSYGKGIKHSPMTLSTKQKISINNSRYWKGRKFSEIHIQHMREARARQVMPYQNTKIEIKMQEELKRRNISFETQFPIIGQPDIFIKPNICIFCDGAYYHGDPSVYKKEDVICLNQCIAEKKWQLDKNKTQCLIDKNFIVLRFWEKEINEDIKKCVDIVEKELYYATVENYL